MMTIHQENESNLLTHQEQVICKKIATRQAPHSQRALALLALNEKSTQAQAAEQANLTTGQVRYWLAKFRRQRLDIFPDTLLNELDADVERVQVELATEAGEEPQPIAKKTDSAKSTKAKKGKKARKAKKDKGKKGKKPKKTRAKKDKQRKRTKKTKKSKKSKKKK